MSRVFRLAQVIAVVALSASFLSHGAAATEAPQTSVDAGPVRVVGAFSNIRYTPEHAYGQQVRLWRQSERLVGLFKFTDGRQADFHTGLLEKVGFNQATGRLSFEAYASEFRFDGTLRKNVVTELLTLKHRQPGSKWRRTGSFLSGALRAQN